MEIRFSKNLSIPLPAAVEQSANAAGARADITSSSSARRIIRFTLWSATVAQYDTAIGHLFRFDPDAVVRTARAVYEGRKDFEAQVAARHRLAD